MILRRTSDILIYISSQYHSSFLFLKTLIGIQNADTTARQSTLYTTKVLCIPPKYPAYDCSKPPYRIDPVVSPSLSYKYRHVPARTGTRSTFLDEKRLYWREIECLSAIHLWLGRSTYPEYSACCDTLKEIRGMWVEVVLAADFFYNFFPNLDGLE